MNHNWLHSNMIDNKCVLGNCKLELIMGNHLSLLWCLMDFATALSLLFISFGQNINEHDCNCELN